jgi:hypothetical protein
MVSQVNLSSEAACRKAYLNYHCYGNTMNLTPQEMGEITSTWSNKLSSWQVTVNQDINEYEFDDDDYAQYKNRGKQAGETATGYKKNQGGDIAAVTGHMMGGAVSATFGTAASAGVGSKLMTKTTTAASQKLIEKTCEKAAEKGGDQAAIEASETIASEGEKSTQPSMSFFR